MATSPTARTTRSRTRKKMKARVDGDESPPNEQESADAAIAAASTNALPTTNSGSPIGALVGAAIVATLHRRSRLAHAKASDQHVTHRAEPPPLPAPRCLVVVGDCACRCSFPHAQPTPVAHHLGGRRTRRLRATNRCTVVGVISCLPHHGRHRAGRAHCLRGPVRSAHSGNCGVHACPRLRSLMPWPGYGSVDR